MSLLWCECRSFTCNLYLQAQSPVCVCRCATTTCVWIHYYRCTFPQSYMRIGPVVFPSSCWQSEQSLFFFLLQNKYSSCVNGRQNQHNNPSTPQGAPKWNKQTDKRTFTERNSLKQLDSYVCSFYLCFTKEKRCNFIQWGWGSWFSGVKCWTAVHWLLLSVVNLVWWTVVLYLKR